MTVQAEPWLLARFRRFTTVAGLAVMLAGGLALIGQTWSIPFLRNVSSFLAAVKPTSAVAFLMGGLSLWLWTREPVERSKRCAAQACAWIVTLLGLFSLGEYLFGWNLKVSQLLSHQPFSPGPAAALARMSFYTALDFVLLGAGLVLLHAKAEYDPRAGQWLALTAAFIALLAILQDVYGVRLFSYSLLDSTIALPTGVLFLVLAGGILCAHPDRGFMAEVAGDTLGGRFSRGLLSAAIVVPFLIGWLIEIAERGGWLEVGDDTAVFATLVILIFTVLIWFNTLALNQLEQERQQMIETSLRLAAIVESSEDAIIGKTLEGEIVSWNRAAERMYGYSAQEAVGKPISLIVPPSHRQEVAGIMDRLRSGRGTTRLESMRRRKDGVEIHVELTVSPIVDPAGRILGVASIGRDITERKRVEEAMRTSEARFRRLFESDMMGVMIADTRGHITEANDVFLKTLGYRRDELPLNGDRMTPPQWRPSDEQAIENLQQRGASPPWEKEYLRKDGSPVPILIGVTLLDESTGRCLCLVHDLSERKRAETQIQEQARLLDLAQDAILVRDLEGRIQFWNRGAERLYGWAASEVTGHKLEEFLCRKPAGCERFSKMLLDEGEWSGELDQVTRNQRAITVSSRWTLLKDAQGHPKSVLIINTDITEKKQLEAKVLRTQRLETIGTLAGGIAHDLNNILAPISMSAALLRETLPQGEESDLVALIETSAQRGADVIKQLLTFGRGVAGERVPVQLKHLVRETIKLARETFPRSITLSFSVPADLWMILGDATQLQQVLLNLFVNARDAMPNGGTLTLEAKNLQLDEDHARANPEAKIGPYVQLQVSDNGHGIAPEILDRIFDPFFTTKEQGKGTGLGLSTVLGIVRSHGGFLRVRSQVGQGSAFEVNLPAAPDVEAIPNTPLPAALPRGQGELILVVDDEMAVRQATRRVLEQHGYAVALASNGAEALAFYAQRRAEIKLVFTDFMMPGMDGLALTRFLMKINPQIKIIAASGLGEESKINELKALGVKSFLTKPYSTDKLLNALQQMLQEDV